MKLKDGYTMQYDNLKGYTHIYPTKGRKHTFDNCWCKPTISKNTIHHNEDPCPNNSIEKCSK